MNPVIVFNHYLFDFARDLRSDECDMAVHVGIICRNDVIGVDDQIGNDPQRNYRTQSDEYVF